MQAQHAAALGLEAAPRRRRVTLYARDWILIFILLFLAGLVASKWSDYSSCADPMAAWLVVNFLGMLIFRALHFLAQYCWNGRPGSWVATKGPGVVMAVDLYVVWPFLLVWMVLGCIWYERSHSCLPKSMSGWAFVAWVVITLLYLFAYASLVLGRVRARAAYPRDPALEPSSARAWVSAVTSAHLIVVEFFQRQELLALGLGPDVGRGAAVGNIIVLQRNLHDAGGALPLMAQQQQAAHTGLTPEQIDAIPLRQLTPAERCNELCSICLVEFAQLPQPGNAQAAEPDQEEGSGGDGAEEQQLRPGIAGRIPRSSSDVESGNAPSHRDGHASSSPDVQLRVDTEGDDAVEVSTARTSGSRMDSGAPIMVHALPCRHCYHVDCLRVWLLEEAKCPNCRMRIGPEPQSPAAAPPVAMHAAAQSPQQQQQQQQQQQPQHPFPPHGPMPVVFVQSSPSAHQSHQQQPAFSPWHGLQLESNIAPSPAVSPYARNWQQQQQQQQQ